MTAREIGDDAVYPFAEQAEEAAHRALGTWITGWPAVLDIVVIALLLAFTRPSLCRRRKRLRERLHPNGPIVLHPSQCNLWLDGSKMIRYISRCKENIALGAIMSKFEYLKLADTVAAEIANGALKPGDRLPPQRSFAYERKIAVSTASRVYTELLRRGLVVGEVGRGTFVSGETRRGIAMPTEPRGARIDLEVNYPILPTQSVMIARSLAGLERPEVLDLALRHSTTTGTQAARTISAEFLSREDWSPPPINSSSPRTAGNASPRRWRRWCRAAAAAASRR